MNINAGWGLVFSRRGDLLYLLMLSWDGMCCRDTKAGCSQCYVDISVRIHVLVPEYFHSQDPDPLFKAVQVVVGLMLF